MSKRCTGCGTETEALIAVNGGKLCESCHKANIAAYKDYLRGAQQCLADYRKRKAKRMWENSDFANGYNDQLKELE